MINGMFSEDMIDSDRKAYFIYYSKKRQEVKQYSIKICLCFAFYFDGIDIHTHNFKRFIKSRVLKMYASEQDMINDYDSVEQFEDLFWEQENNRHGLEICFTGFEERHKRKLQKIAHDNGFLVRTTITNNLYFLCVGHKTNTSTILFTKASDRNIPMITEKQFYSLLETGEIPPPESGDEVVTKAINDNDTEIYNAMVEECQLNFKTIKTSRRTNALLAIFQDGYAAGWRFAVHQSHADELDIKYTAINRNSHTVYAWTQGNSFQFRRGSVFYSHKPSNANFNNDNVIALQVKYDCLSGYEPISMIDGEFSGEYTPLRAHGKRELQSVNLSIELQQYDRGDIIIDVFKQVTGKMIFVTELKMNQDEFIFLLQTGKFIHTDTTNLNKPSFVDIFEYVKEKC